MVKHVIIDCDPGIDDTLALLLAFASDVIDVRAVTTVAGNVAASITAGNALAVCALLNRDVEVAMGAEKPLEGEAREASNVNGKNGIGDVRLPAAGEISSRDSVTLLYEELLKAQGALEIIALGPLTNIALLLTQHPDVKSYIKKISLMGGSLGRGNVTPHAEFNFYADPLAADIVLRSGVPIDMYGLDVTNQALIYDKDLSVIEAIGGPVLTPVAEMIRYYQKFYKSKGLDGLKMHDPLVVAALIKPDLVTCKLYPLCVDTGHGETRGKVRINEDPAAPASVNAALSLDLPSFLELFMELLQTYR